uniref:Uncharacterized protein n=1 Tax=Rhizophora mucronata TaxID=61149 RepID=A0A2P2Q8U2_RHIMU
MLKEDTNNSMKQDVGMRSKHQTVQ